MSNWGNLNEVDDKKFNDWFDKFVPACGACETLGGEILRAISRIIYRYYNDGDTVDRYYGSDYNCCKGADIFLEKNVSNYVTLIGVSDFSYEKEISKRLKFIVDYLTNNPNVFEIPNTDDYLNYQTYEPHYEDDWDWDDDLNEDED